MSLDICLTGEMLHPGMPVEWGLAIGVFMILSSAWFLFAPSGVSPLPWRFDLARLPGMGQIFRLVSTAPWVLLVCKVAAVSLFLLIIAAGLYGLPVADRNLATVFTWNLWWAGLIVSVFFLGTAWCAICPWDTLATWLVTRRLWGRGNPDNRLNLKVPKWLRSTWPALIMFVGLTWLELGFGITVSPSETAILALVLVVMTTISLAVFERKAFCRYFCPVGRTIGVYAQLAPVELRPVDQDVCARCTTLECFYGTESVDPCPTHLVMGRLKQNTFCTSCGNCTQSCPEQNISWHMRPTSAEAAQTARPRWDIAWFMVILLALTGFHGLTMLTSWETAISQLGRLIGDQGQLLWSFSIGLVLAMTVPTVFYVAMVQATRRLSGTGQTFRQSFATLASITLPFAFSYHLAHNLNHLWRENGNIGALLLDPFGPGGAPLNALELQIRHLDMMEPNHYLFAIQAMLLIWAFTIAMKVLRHRGLSLLESDATDKAARWRLAPMLVFALSINAWHIWLLTREMVMRM